MIRTAVYWLILFLISDGAVAQEKTTDVDDVKKSDTALTIESVLERKLDFLVEDQSLAEALDALHLEVRKTIPNTKDFSILIIGNDLREEGITRNQRINELKLKQVTIKDVLNNIVVKANPNREVRDPSDPRQQLVWTIGPDLKDKEKKVILITTRRAAKAKEYQLPVDFSPKDEDDKSGD